MQTKKTILIVDEDKILIDYLESKLFKRFKDTPDLALLREIVLQITAYLHTSCDKFTPIPQPWNLKRFTCSFAASS